jgi:hypothetical protein
MERPGSGRTSRGRMKGLPIFRNMTRRNRRQRIAALLERIEVWEKEGINLFAQVVELTDPDDDLGAECRRVLDLLAG